MDNDLEELNDDTFYLYIGFLLTMMGSGWFWDEHRPGMFWASAVTACIFLLCIIINHVDDPYGKKKKK